MKIIKYLKSVRGKLFFLIYMTGLTNLLLYLVFDMKMKGDDVIYLNELLLVGIIIYLFSDFISWKKNIFPLEDKLKNEEENFIIDYDGSGYHFELIQKILEKKQNEKICDEEKYRDTSEELRDYIVKWAHEIKMPISVCNLVLERMDKNKDIGTLEEQVDKIEYYIEQILYMNRTTSYHEDLTVSQANLRKLVSNIIKKNMVVFIHKNVEVSLENLEYEISTDTKWMSYIIEQVINNCGKYIEENGNIKISAEENQQYVVLKIRDNGIGIPKKNIDRIFDRGFNGDEGMNLTKSTGMGLYICKKMCHKLGYKIEAHSELGEYTEISIYISKYSDFLNV